MVVVSVVLIFIAKFGIHCRLARTSEPKWEPLFHRNDLHLMALLLIYRLSSTCLCRSAILFGENLIIQNGSSASILSSVTNTDESSQDATVPSQTSILTMAAAATDETGDSLYIVRNNLGDTFFDVDHTWLTCSMEKCVRKSSGTATVALELANVGGDGRKLFLGRYSPNDKMCHCSCHQSTPTFREDLHVCVNDIHECALVSFVSSNSQQKIPYVFLPLRGQIINPNAEIKFHGLHSVPTCIVSRVRYLSRSGWCDIRNYSTDHGPLPFRLFHDKQRTFLQWLGNAELRASMEGRLLLIDLICKDSISQRIFTPCISFRIAGVPRANNFFPDELLDRNLSFEREKKFSAHEYVALGFATILIALIYIASVFMYLHFKKSKLKETSMRRNNVFKPFVDMEDNTSHLFSDGNSTNTAQSKQLIVEQEGLVKNNPLLMKRYHSPSPPANRNTSMASEEGRNFGVDQVELYKPVGSKQISSPEHSRMQNVHALKTNQFAENTEPRWSIFRNRLLQRNFESHPHIEVRTEIKTAAQKTPPTDANNIEEKHPDENISIVECPEDVVPTNSKHKLYFNPAYLEPELLMAPPPAAVEFLFKIREIMSMAKRKILTKKFLPTLTEIPEETRSREDSSITQGTSSSHARSAEKRSSPYLLKEDKEKRQIIQKWLQTIPTSNNKSNSIVNKEFSTFLATDEPKSLTNEHANEVSAQCEQIPNNDKKETVDTCSHRATREAPPKPKRTSAKSVYKESSPSVVEMPFDSLEKKHIKLEQDNIEKKIESAPTTNFGSNLPLDEELTMQNAIFNVVTGSTTVSKLKMREHACLEDFQENAEDNKYSLVSEVYVNDEFSSNDSASSTNSVDEEDLEEVVQASKDVPVSSDKQFQESSRLMIQLNDCPFFYSMENTDDFEPDTLDRKVVHDEPQYQTGGRSKFVDSLERSAICLRSHGSFRNDLSPPLRSQNNSLKRSFGSLQEIYQLRRHLDSPKQIPRDDGPQSLSPQVETMLWKRDNMPPRHYFRQCKQSSPPPLPKNVDEPKPPLPPKKEKLSETQLVAPNFRTNVNSIFANRALKLCFNNNMWSYKPDDSGYLSSSNSEKSQTCSQTNTLENRDSIGRIEKPCANEDDDDDDDDDESCSNDGNSESGAESTATNFKFYKNSVKLISDLNENCEKEQSVVSPC